MSAKLFVIPLLFVCMACGGKKHNPAPAPGQAVLISPAKDALCTTGAVLSPTQSSVSFTWNASANTDSYNLIVKNLITSATITQSTTATQIAITLDRNTPYSWSVLSKSSKSDLTALSDIWKFYNAGPGVITYAPYPAELSSPAFGQKVNTATVNLTWIGSAINNTTIANYDVYFGTTETPALLKNAVTDSFVNGVNVNSGTTYYWKVITRDINGNTSDSGLSEFSTE